MTDTELTRDEAINLADELGYELYRAEDVLAFIREQLDSATGPIEPTEIRKWLDRSACLRAGPHTGPSADGLVRILRHARVSVLQQAFRELGWNIDFELTEGDPE